MGLVVRLVALTVVMAAAMTGGGAASGAGTKPAPQKWSVTTTYDERADEVRGSARNVGGSWQLALEWRATSRSPWQALAGGPQRGRAKASAANVVHSPGFDFSGHWRTCVIRHPFGRGEKRFCGPVVEVR